MNYMHHCDSPLGGITMTSDGTHLTGLLFDDEKYFDSTFRDQYQEGELPVFAEADRWLELYFSGKEPDFTPPVLLQTTPFRRRVCEIIGTIPYGKTMTYGQIASRIADERGIERMSAQAVGGAVGHNPISLIIPCHRVVGSDGSLTGYAGGIDKKVRLLTLEGADMSGLYVPEKGTAL